MRRNKLRELLRAGKPSLATHLANSWPTVVELIGNSGRFDYVEFQAAYQPYDLYALENMGRAIALFDHMSGMIKVDQQPYVRGYLAERAIGMGIQNVLFPDVRTVADVEECVRSVRADTPRTGGWHGVGMRRDVGVVLEIGSQAFVQALEDTVVAIMIGKKEAVENLEAILSVKGVDMVQFGPADYAMSIGKPGPLSERWSHPEVLEAERYVIETAMRKGIAPRAEPDTPEEAVRYLDMGVQHFCIGTDVFTLFDWYKETGRAMRELLSKIPERTR